MYSVLTFVYCIVITTILTYVQWNGSTCNKDEKFKAVQYTQKIKTERSGKPKVEVLEERDMTPNHKFYSSLSDGTAEKEPEEVGHYYKA